MPHIDAFGASTTQYPEALVDKFINRRLVVVGGAKCVWDDLRQIGVRGEADNNGYDIMAVNDIVMHYPGRVRHLYSNDHRWIPKWLAARREGISRDYGNVDFVHSCNQGAQYNWPWPGNGTSSLGAAYCGVAMGYKTIILCGVPLDNSPHYFEPDWIETNFQNEVPDKDVQMKYWTNARDNIFKGRVKSMSGRTKELLNADS